MSSNPICRRLHETDFNSPADLRRILYQDKHTRIEGLCSEIAFSEDVLKGSLDPVTGNFWFTSHKSSYAVTRILSTSVCTLSELDYQILDGFSSVASIPVQVVFFDAGSRTFRCIAHCRGVRYGADLSKMGTVLKPLGGQEMAGAVDRNVHRLEKACSYIEEHGLLYEMAVHRLYANCWLRGGVWDVDGFTRTRTGNVVALEVKQKYATAGGTFGINQGQASLFRFLNRLGMPVIHVILEKPVRDMSISAVDLLREEIYTSVTRWLYTRFTPSKYAPASQPAPAFTSIYGGQELNYEHIPASLFSELKRFGQRTNDVRTKLLAGLDGPIGVE